MGTERYYTQEKNRRLKALRDFKRLEHACDTALELIERRIERIQKNRYTVTKETALTLVPLHNDFIARVRDMEKGLADLFQIINT